MTNERLMEELLGALQGLRYTTSSGCFCQVSIGNPMCTEHSAACNAAMSAVEKAQERVDTCLFDGNLRPCPQHDPPSFDGRPDVQFLSRQRR